MHVEGLYGRAGGGAVPGRQVPFQVVRLYGTFQGKTVKSSRESRFLMDPCQHRNSKECVRDVNCSIDNDQFQIGKVGQRSFFTNNTPDCTRSIVCCTE